MKKIALLFFSIFICQILNAQKMELGIMAFPNLLYSSSIDEATTIKLNPNGSGLKVQYNTQFNNLPFQNTFGLELSTVDWGNQILSRIGIIKSFPNEQWRIEAMLLNGLALYVEQPAYVFGLETNVTYYISINQKSRIKISAGLRYTQNPAYKKVGLYRFIDMPVSVSWIVR